MWQCLEKLAAIAGGCVVAAAGSAAHSGLDPGTAVGALMGAAGLVGFFGENAERHGPESSGYLSAIRAAVIERLGDPPQWRGADAATIAGWDWSLREALPLCMLDRRRLAEAFFAGDFPAVAAEIVLKDLQVSEPQFALEPARSFAGEVIRTALDGAYAHRKYFEGLVPDLWRALARRLDRIEVAADEAADQARIAAASAHHAALIAERIEYKADLRHGLICSRFKRLTPEQIALLPTRLLVAEHGQTPYYPLSSAVEDLVGWATSGGGVLGRLVVGAGGLGKTRLALEVAERLAQQGWKHAGLLSAADLALPHAERELRVMMTDPSTRGVFFVLDYADTRTSQVRMVVRAARLAQSLTGARPVRVLLIARSAGVSDGEIWREVEGDWWHALLDPQASDTAPERQCLARTPILIGAAHRISLEACQNFISTVQGALELKFQTAGLEGLLRKPGQRGIIADSVLASEAARSPLMLTIAAYLSLVGDRDIEDPLGDLVNEEAEHWRRSLGGRAGERTLSAMRYAMAEITLCQGLPVSEAEAIARRACEQVFTASSAARDLARAELKVQNAILKLYGDTALRPVLPDLVGECVAGQAITERPEMIAEVLNRYPDAVETILHVINRISHPSKADPKASLRARVAAPVGEALTSALTSPPRFGELIRSLLVVASREDGGAGPAAQRAMEANAPAIAHSAGAVILSAWYEDFGHRPPPLYLRSLFTAAALNASAFSLEAPQGALSLEQHFQLELVVQKVLGDLGKDSQALEVARRAVDKAHWLQDQTAQDSSVRIAIAMGNMAAGQARLGKTIEAIRTSQEALDLLKRAMPDNRSLVGPLLVIALANLVGMLTRSDRDVEAVAYAREAVAILEAMPDVHGAMDAIPASIAYLNLASTERQVDELPAALRAIEVAVGMRGTLFEENPATYGTAYAAALMVQGIILYDMERYEEAEKVLLQALSIYALRTSGLTVKEQEGLSRAAMYYRKVAQRLGRSIETADADLEAATGLRPVVVGDDMGLDAQIDHLKMTLELSRSNHASNPFGLANALGPINQNLAELFLRAGNYPEAAAAAEEAERAIETLMTEYSAPLHAERLSAILCQAAVALNAEHPRAIAQALLGRAIAFAETIPPNLWPSAATLHFSAVESFLNVAAQADEVEFGEAFDSIGGFSKHPMLIAHNGWASAHNAEDYELSETMFAALRWMLGQRPDLPFATTLIEAINEKRAHEGAAWRYGDIGAP